MSEEMYPRIVEEAPKGPSQCLFSQDQEGPWIDTGMDAPWIRPHGYIGVRYVEGLARDLLDMIPRRDVEAQLEEMRAQLAAYAERVGDLENFVEATVTYQETREGAGIA